MNLEDICGTFWTWLKEKTKKRLVGLRQAAPQAKSYSQSEKFQEIKRQNTVFGPIELENMVPQGEKRPILAGIMSNRKHGSNFVQIWAAHNPRLLNDPKRKLLLSGLFNHWFKLRLSESTVDPESQNGHTIKIGPTARTRMLWSQGQSLLKTLCHLRRYSIKCDNAENTELYKSFFQVSTNLS